MTSKEIREAFLDFFKSKQHEIVPSAPMVVKNDPTLMFTNAGMNQFKDIFLGDCAAKSTRVTDSQKCLRVSGKHNDLEEVGYDTYHHTMFEMLGNWSFGDYFKKEAIDWSWELLIDTLKIDKDRIYATVFEGSKEDGVGFDTEAQEYWEKHLPKSRILTGNKKDNFWEMGDTGPCGPCSEIHVDIRDDHERAAVDGATLVNMDHPQVIEIWNLVFMQFNRKASGELMALPQTHVDTGMGFERLCMIIQGKQSSYDTDLFQPIIGKIGGMCGKKYGDDKQVDIAMRVISDHIRTIAFSIAESQLPSNNKAGYVIRRILRRAVRYGHTFLGLNRPFLCDLIPVLVETMGYAFPELVHHQKLITDVTREEEESFLRTLDTGINMLDGIIKETLKNDYKVISGSLAFELYDTYGFPLDLTELILKENGLVVNRKEFQEQMEVQKARSRSAAAVDTGDWVELLEDDVEEFVGYDQTETSLKITRYRKIKQKGKELYQLVFNYTPFYGESGGQVGDTGSIECGDDKCYIIDTKRENKLTVHITKSLPKDVNAVFTAKVNADKRTASSCNHTATHLLGQALREILGDHIEQKGSYVSPERLRFDFSHYQKVTDEQLIAVQRRVNALVRENIQLEEYRNIPMVDAEKLGAVALFGEKYGDIVRVIKYGESLEFCGGTHVKATGNIGQILILSEGSVSSGIRRIEAVTGVAAEDFLIEKVEDALEIASLLNTKKDIKGAVEQLIAQNGDYKSQLEQYAQKDLVMLKKELQADVKVINGINVIATKVELKSAAAIKDLAFMLKADIDNLYLVLGAEIDGKASLAVMISDNLVAEKSLNAGAIIRTIAKSIQGGGGGQPFFATAGGKNPAGLDEAIAKALELI